MVGVELADMLASINLKVEALVPCVPMQHTFGRDGLQNFIHNHQDYLEQLEGQLSDLITMTEHVVGRLSAVNESYCLLRFFTLVETNQPSGENRNEYYSRSPCR